MYNMLSDSRFLLQVDFPDECVFQVLSFTSTWSNRIWGTEDQTGNQRHQFHRKQVTGWCDLYGKDGVGQITIYFISCQSWLFSNAGHLRSVRRFNILAGWSLQQNGAASHITGAVPSLLIWFCPISSIGGCGQTDWRLKCPDLDHWTFSSEHFLTIKCIRNLGQLIAL